MKLKIPSEKYKKQYEELIKEWGKIENLSEISPGALFYGKNFEEFLDLIKYHSVKGDSVKSQLFFLIDDDNILGGIDIRHHINHPNLIEKGGHIGYGIAPKFRKQGYATKMLELGIKEARKLGVDKILITCDIDNIASNKVIKNNGGIFERITKDGEVNRYWIF